MRHTLWLNPEVYEYLSANACNVDFGNGRGVGRYFDSIMGNQDTRLNLLDESALDEEELKIIYRTFTEEDVIGAHA